jgi:hypothetical protein
MAISKQWLTEKNIQLVLKRIREKDCPSNQQMAAEFHTTPHNIGWILRNHLGEVEYRAVKVVRYSRSKTGKKNPMFGKRGEETPNWKGEVNDGYGYLTCLQAGKRQFVHRTVMAKALGIPILPRLLDVHHIDGNKHNNHLDNLALTTRVGHQAMHAIMRPESAKYKLKKSTLWEAFQSMTSR